MADPRESDGILEEDTEPQTNGDRMNGIYHDLPDALIVTNVDESVFNNATSRKEFEDEFKEFDALAVFQYLKCFRRARVNYSDPEFAAKAKIHLHQTSICGQYVKCYFAQPKEEETENKDPHLVPPVPQKQFLISPPASPPVGWEQAHETEPVINYDLLSAVAKLSPGDSHELHPPSDKHPAIIVHTCEDPESNIDRPSKIIQTRCPERTT